MSAPTIRGFAVTFESTRPANGGLLTFCSQAFDLDDDPEIQLGAHGGPIIRNRGELGLTLFRDFGGLAFEANIIAGVSSVLDFIRGGAGVSVGPRDVRGYTTEEGALRHVTVTGARLDHLTITRRPVFTDTACWLAEDQEAGVLPEGLQAVSRRWLVARAQSRQASLSRGSSRQDRYSPDVKLPQHCGEFVAPFPSPS